MKENGHAFKLDDCWDVLKVSPKFSTDSTEVFDMTRSQPDEDFLDFDGISQEDTPGTPITQSLNDDDLETPCDRPMGRKASKQAARDGGKRKSVGGQRSEGDNVHGSGLTIDRCS